MNSLVIIWNKNAFLMLAAPWCKQLCTWHLHATRVTDYGGAVPGDLPPAPMRAVILHPRTIVPASRLLFQITLFWPGRDMIIALPLRLTRRHYFKPRYRGLNGWRDWGRIKTDMRQREMRNTTALYGFHKVWSDMVGRSYKHRGLRQTCRLNLPTPPLVVLFGLSVLQRTA